MKKVLLKIKYMAVVLCATVTLTSCNDFLGTVPLNEIVLENFWENEEEVNSVVEQLPPLALKTITLSLGSHIAYSVTDASCIK